MASAFDYVKQLEALRSGAGGGGLQPYQAPQPESTSMPLHQRLQGLGSLANYTGSSAGASSIPDLAGLDLSAAPKGGAYTDQMRQAYALARSLGVSSIGGYANRNIAGTNKPSAHAKSRAWDLMVGKDKSLGDSLAEKYVGLASQLGLKNIIWHDKIWDPRRGWRPYGHPGGGRNDTLQHRDHLHLEWD